MYRYKLLKRQLSNVLFLDIKRKAYGMGISQVIASVGAGLAMLFAILVTVASMLKYEQTSWTFIWIAVVSYILKDRIKDGFKHYLGKKISKHIYDYDASITTPKSGAEVGKCRESFSFVSSKMIEPEIMSMRHRSRKGETNLAVEDEEIMQYDKYIRINQGKMLKEGPILYDFNDIVTFDVSEIISRAADTYEKNPAF